MFSGLFSGLTWGLNVVLISLFMQSFKINNLLIAPLIASFMHDSICLVYTSVYLAAKKRLKVFKKVALTKDGLMMVLASFIGGPIGFTAFVLAIYYIGASLTAIITAIFPAFGTYLAFVFLKEKRKVYQVVFLLISILGIIGLGYTSAFEIKNIWLGIFLALVCVLGWSFETVMCTHLVKSSELDNEFALMLKQITSTVAYLVIVVILYVLGVFNFESISANYYIIMFAALVGTISFLYYYKSLSLIGASKTMALNITYSAFALVFGYFILNEAITLNKLLFGTIIIVGSIISAYDK